MDTRKKIIVADPRDGYRRFVVEAIQQDKDLEVVGDTGDGGVLLDLITQHSPDLIVLEMNLKSVDGIEVLERLQEMKLDARPKILVVSNLLRSVLPRMIADLGVDYCMAKPCQLSRIIQRIRLLTQVKEEVPPSVALERRVTRVLQEMGMPAHILGYQYLRWAICITVYNPELLHGVTKILYPMVGKEFASTASRVERSIRHAIDMAWTRGDMEAINRYFGNTISSRRGRPTNAEFIALISDRLRLDEQIR